MTANPPAALAVSSANTDDVNVCEAAASLRLTATPAPNCCHGRERGSRRAARLGSLQGEFPTPQGRQKSDRVARQHRGVAHQGRRGAAQVGGAASARLTVPVLDCFKPPQETIARASTSAGPFGRSWTPTMAATLWRFGSGADSFEPLLPPPATGHGGICHTQRRSFGATVCRRCI